METKIIISATSEETRMGLTENGRLMEYLVERSSEKHLVGNIFKGRVNNVVPGIQAAFIDIGLQQNAFLYLGESNDITEGKSILVQITKDARGSKGPSATRELTLPGRYVVLLPLADYIGVSHKIENKEERNRLKAIIEEQSLMVWESLFVRRLLVPVRKHCLRISGICALTGVS